MDDTSFCLLALIISLYFKAKNTVRNASTRDAFNNKSDAITSPTFTIPEIGIVGISASGLEIVQASAKIMRKNNSQFKPRQYVLFIV